MPLTDEDRLRQMLGDRVPLAGDEGDTFFDNEEIADLLELHLDLNSAALAGWMMKMAEFAKLVDADISGAERKYSQRFKQAESMVDHFTKVVGAEVAAIVGRVVGRAINLRESWCPPAVMTGSSGFRPEAVNMEAKQILINSQPETFEEDPSYPEPGPVAG